MLHLLLLRCLHTLTCIFVKLCSALDLHRFSVTRLD